MDYYEVTTGPNYNSSTGWASELNQIHVPQPHGASKDRSPYAITDLSAASGC